MLVYVMYTNGDIVGGEEAGERARAVVDGELGAVGAVRAGLRAVILVVKHCDIQYICFIIITSVQCYT